MAMNMLPAYGSMASFDPQFFPNYPATYNASMMSQYASPVTSFCPPPFYDVTSSGLKSESDSSSSPSAIAKLSPEEQQKYRDKRDRNNLAAKQSRIKRSQREKCLQDEVSSLKAILGQLRQENMQWQHQDQVNKATIHQLNQELLELRSQVPQATKGPELKDASQITVHLELRNGMLPAAYGTQIEPSFFNGYPAYNPALANFAQSSVPIYPQPAEQTVYQQQVKSESDESSPPKRTDPKYRVRRDRNNAAARRSRQSRKHREEHLQATVEQLSTENEHLRNTVTMLQQRISELSQLVVTSSCQPMTSLSPPIASSMNVPEVFRETHNTPNPCNDKSYTTI